jgi:hypothetical protein
MHPDGQDALRLPACNVWRQKFDSWGLWRKDHSKIASDLLKKNLPANSGNRGV